MVAAKKAALFSLLLCMSCAAPTRIYAGAITKFGAAVLVLGVVYQLETIRHDQKILNKNLQTVYDILPKTDESPEKLPLLSSNQTFSEMFKQIQSFGPFQQMIKTAKGALESLESTDKKK
jgi:hypothetical protein